MKSYSLATLTFVSSALALTVKRVVPPGAMVIQPGYSVYKCLTASNTNKAAPSIQDCVPNAENQLWLVDGNTIQNIHKKCLDVPSGNQANKQKLQVYQCTSGNLNQVFAFNDTLIQLQGTSKCMDLTDGKRSNGVVPQLYTCDAANPNQVWNLAEQLDAPLPPAQSPYPDGSPAPIVPIASTATCLTAVSNNNAAKVVAEPCDDTDNQAFTYIGGQFRIFGNMCLDVTNGKRVKGTKMQIYTCGDNTNKNQIFQVNTPSGYPQGHQIALKSVPTLCLDLTNGSYKNGNQVQVYTCTNAKLTNSNQYFYLNEAEFENDN